MYSGTMGDDIDLVFERDGHWWFLDETWVNEHGPYSTKEFAEYGWLSYICSVLGVTRDIGGTYGKQVEICPPVLTDISSVPEYNSITALSQVLVKLRSPQFSR
jgi:hypothetical protein